MKEFILLSTFFCLLTGCAPQPDDIKSEQQPESRAQQGASADSLSAADDCMGEPLSDMMCTQQYQPVCGCNKQTYSNACVAKVAGVMHWTDGPCGGSHPNE